MSCRASAAETLPPNTSAFLQGPSKRTFSKSRSKRRFQRETTAERGILLSTPQVLLQFFENPSSIASMIQGPSFLGKPAHPLTPRSDSRPAWPRAPAAASQPGKAGRKGTPTSGSCQSLAFLPPCRANKCVYIYIYICMCVYICVLHVCRHNKGKITRIIMRTTSTIASFFFTKGQSSLTTSRSQAPASISMPVHPHSRNQMTCQEASSSRSHLWKHQKPLPPALWASMRPF